MAATTLQVSRVIASPSDKVLGPLLTDAKCKHIRTVSTALRVRSHCVIAIATLKQLSSVNFCELFISNDAKYQSKFSCLISEIIGVNGPYAPVHFSIERKKRKQPVCVIVFSVFSVSSVPMRNISIKPFLRNRSMSMEEWDMPKLRQRSFSGSEDGAGSPAKSPAKAANNSTAGSVENMSMYSPVLLEPA